MEWGLLSHVLQASFILFDIREKSWEGQKENMAYSKHAAFLYRKDTI